MTTKCCSLPLPSLRLNQTPSSSSTTFQRSAAHVNQFDSFSVPLGSDWLSCESQVLTPSAEETPERVGLTVLQMCSPQNGAPPPSPGVTGDGDSLLSPPSVATLLDISLPGPPEEALAPGEPQTHISDSIIELAINSAHYGTRDMYAFINIQMSSIKNIAQLIKN